MKTMTKSILFLFCILFFMSASECTGIGTDTGNPFHDAVPGQCGKLTTKKDYSTSCVPSPMVAIQAGIISKKLAQCLSLDQDSVFKNVYTQPELSKEITIAVDTFQELQFLYQHREITVEQVAYDSCAKAIEDLQCESTIIQNALKFEGDTVDYSNVHSILHADPACKNVYSFKTESTD